MFFNRAYVTVFFCFMRFVKCYRFCQKDVDEVRFGFGREKFWQWTFEPLVILFVFKIKIILYSCDHFF